MQNAYSVLDRSNAPVLEVCREHGIAWVPFFPLGSAFPSLPKATTSPTVVAIADQLKGHAGSGGARLVARGYDQTLLIPGTSESSHLAENIAAGSVRLPPEAVTALDQLAGD